MIENKVLETIRRENLIEPNDKILVALSGGADSMTLLTILNELKSKLNITIYAAHLNHQIRGYEAHSDAIFSYRECKKNGIPCFLKSIDVVKFAKESKISIEEAARKIRYDLLFEIKNRLKLDKIAIAHNQDDQAETVLMRICRGTGISGLKGIQYKRRDGVIRPLLDVSREEIEKYCHENKVPYITDSTNEKEIYTRNKVRLSLIPYLEENYSPNIKTHLSKLAQNVKEDDSFIEKIVDSHYRTNHTKISDFAIKFEVDYLINLDLTIKKRMIKRAYMELNAGVEGIENIHLEDAIKILNSSKTNSSINFPNGITIEKIYNDFYITKKEMQFESKNFEYLIELNKETYIPELDIKIETKIISRDATNRLNTSSTNVKSFDFDKISGNLFVRNRRQGDKIKSLGSSGTKKVKDIFIDKKIPNHKKDEIPIIVDEKKLIWIYGHYMSDDAKIDETTKTILKISIIRNVKK